MVLMILGLSFSVMMLLRCLPSSSMLSKFLQINSCLSNHHIFSAGLSSGAYGGRKMHTMFSGIVNLLAL